MERFAESLASFEFTYPFVFWTGFLLMLFFIFVPFSNKKNGLVINLRYWQSKIQLRDKGILGFQFLIGFTTILIAMTIADPQVITKNSVTIYGKPVMLVIDVSGSMEYKGLGGQEGISAREKAQIVLEDILSRGIEADLGLLIYSSENYIARFFVYKDTLLRDTLENDEEINFISTGTRTAEALAKARNFFLSNEESEQKAIILISDLESDLEAIMEVAEEVDRDLLAGIKVYAIVTDGEDRWAKHTPSNQPSIEGMTIIGMNNKDGIDWICKEIDAMKNSPIRKEESSVKISLVPYLIPATIGLIVFSLVLSETTLRKIT